MRVAAVAHRLQHPHDVVAVRVDRIGEVEAAAAALRTGDDEQVRKAVAVQAEKRLRAFRLPLLLQRAAVATGDHVERRRRHPLEAGRVDQHVERIFDAVVHHASFVDADARRVGAVSTRWTCGRLKHGRYSSWNVGRLQPYG